MTDLLLPASEGAFYNVPFDEYAADKAVNKTLLSHMAVTPADARDYLDNGGEMSDALEFGIGTHCLILEPEKFNEEFAIGPDVKLNTREGKAEWAAFALKHPDKQLIRGADGAAMLGMRERLFAHPEASKLLAAPGENEVTIRWRDARTGLACKGRPDRIIEWEGGTAVVDYKTARDASRSGFPKVYGDCLYYLQEAFYRDGVESATGVPVDRFFFIAQEKTSTYKVNVFEFPLNRVAQGRRLYQALLDMYAHCSSKNQWPAIGPEYDTGLIQTDVPAYAMKNAE